MMLKPFDYQEWAINDLRRAARHKRRLLLCMLMGAGKTLCALEIMRLSCEKGFRCLFICDRRMLAGQGVERALHQGLNAGLILAGRGTNLRRPCQFASKQTVLSWIKRGILVLPEFDLIIVDEAHRAVSQEWQRLFARWPKAILIGLSATPCLGNGNGMGAYYDYLCQPIKPSDLLKLGRIVPVRAFAPHRPNLKGVKKDANGDYQTKSLSERMSRANLIADVSGWWLKLADGRPTIVFACDIAHALAILDDFRSHGIPAEMICDETPDDERADIRRRCESGEVKVVVNCDVLCEGVDWPFISCIQLVRPTKRLRRYLQAAGRGMRAHPGKKDMLLIDHAGCVLLHGFPDIDREWPLSANDNIDKKNQSRPKESFPIQCSQCRALFTGTRICPECGHKNLPPPRLPHERATRNGVLVETSRIDLPPEVAKLLQERFWGTCIGTAIKRRKHAGMAAAMFQNKFGIPPWQANVSPMPDSKDDWKRPAEDVFPGFVKKRKPSREQGDDQRHNPDFRRSDSRMPDGWHLD